MTHKQELQKGLKQRHVNFIALGGIIGSSYFLGTGYVLKEVGPAACLAYILGGLITFLTLACLVELSVGDPMHGSFISYSAKYISPSWACGVGWSYWVSWVVYIPSECIAAGILMHSFMPELPVYLWAILFGILISLINLAHVKVFGELEFWLALIKLFLLISFSVLAIVIFFGLLPHQMSSTSKELGGTYLFHDGGFFPNGYMVLFLNMIILLSNYQGSEIIGISAAESHDPQISVPRALKQTTYRIIGLYLIPTFLLAVIFPWDKAGLSGSVFAIALDSYGLHSFSRLFTFLVIAGALSCANSGLYAAVRSLHGLALHNMGPAFLRHVTPTGVPAYCALLTIGSVWVMLLGSYFFPSHAIYAGLLAISGFTGSVCWISICWAQLRFRRKMERENSLHLLTYKIRWFPYLTQLAIWLQIGCLVVVVLSPTLRLSFYLGVPVTLIPVLLYHFIKHNKPIID